MKQNDAILIKKSVYVIFLEFLNGFLWNALLGGRKNDESRKREAPCFFKISVALMALRIRKKIVSSHFL